MSTQEPNAQTIIVVQESQALPAIMSFFFSGIGQMIQGRALAGLLWLFTEVVLGTTLLILSLGFGLVFTFPTHVLCIVDAATYKPRSGKKLGTLPLLGLCINGIGLLLVIMMWSGAAMSQ